MINQTYMTCRICRAVGGLFITRTSKLATGKIKTYPDNVCRLCANEQSRENYYKRRNNPSWVEKERLRLKEYKRKNKEKIRAKAKIYWLRYRDEISERRKLKRKLVGVKRKKNSHHRIPTNKSMFDNFSLKSKK